MKPSFHQPFDDTNEFETALESILLSHQLENEFGVFKWRRVETRLNFTLIYELKFEERHRILGVSRTRSNCITLIVKNSAEAKAGRLSFEWLEQCWIRSNIASVIVTETSSAILDLLNDKCEQYVSVVQPGNFQQHTRHAGTGPCTNV